jgi:hypothetical protein
MAEQEGVDMDIIDAGAHDRRCKCQKCKKYWMLFTPEEGAHADDIYDFLAACPFTEEELNDGRSSTEHPICE